MEKKLQSKLVNIAKEARLYGYAPYSTFRVGAALLAKNRKIYTGCNMEISNFSTSICAERTALVKAISDGQREFLAIAVIGSFDNPIPPCGQCRQALSEFGSDIEIIMATIQNDYTDIVKLSELLPKAFQVFVEENYNI
jgi:cytidine deaminase